MISLFGIVIGLVLLVIFAYKGFSILWAAPICALIVAATGGLNLLDTYAITYMEGFVSFTKAWFPTFMLGAIFGNIMQQSGAARAVGHWVAKILGVKRALLAVVLSCAAMTYGGISVFVAIFVVYPIASSLFREANISKTLIPGCFALGAFTFTMTALPGTPQIQNLIPMQYLGTTQNAAPVLGIISAVMMFVLGMLWMTYRQKKLEKAGIGYIASENEKSESDEKVMNPVAAFLPLVSVVVVLAVSGQIIIAILVGIVVAIITGLRSVKEKGIVKIVNEGAISSMQSIINTSAVVGFGSVVRSVAGFSFLTEALLGLGGNPIIAVALCVNILCGATGSSSGGLGLALEVLGERFAALSASSGIPMSVVHRVASLSSGGLDSLPHNGAVITCLSVCGLTHKDSYIDICVTSVIIPILTTIVVVILASLGLTF